MQDLQLLNYLDSYHLGRFAGETKTPREEKEILQFLARGNAILSVLQLAQELLKRLPKEDDKETTSFLKI